MKQAVRIWSVICMTLAALGLCGCSSTELEDKNFPMAAVIAWQDGSYEMALGFQELSDVADENTTGEKEPDVSIYGENGYELFEQADAKNPGQMDYNHMKALILSQELFSREQQMEALLSCLEEQNVIARNTLLFVTEDEPAAVIASSEVIKDNVGNYLQELITSNQDFKADAPVTLGALLNARYNQDETLMIPRVSVTEQGLELADYFVLRGMEPVGSISFEQGEVVMLSCGLLKHYGVTPDADTMIRLSDISCSYQLEGDESGVTETVYLSANATAYTGKVPVNLKEYLEKDLEQKAAKLLAAGIDPTDSYYKLGGYDRKAYQVYAGNCEKYQENLSIHYVCRIHTTQ
ncbi:MAG: hypothetical protein ACI4DO_10560 [Roseburia sp.]